MYTVNHLKRTVLVTQVAAALLLTACGGGSNNTSVTTSGRLVAPIVQGVSFSTATTSGVTTAEGGFSCQSGETVTLKVGSVILGTLPCTAPDKDLLDTVSGISADTLIPLMQQAATNPTPNAYDKLLNRLAFLIRMDSDQNISNGVSLPSGLANLPHMQSGALNFNLDYAVFMPRLEQLVGQAMRAGLYTQRPQPLLGCDCTVEMQQAYLVKLLEKTTGKAFPGYAVQDIFSTKADSSGFSTSLRYDAAGKLISSSETPQSDAKPQVNYTFQYDSAERLLSKLGVEATTSLKHAEEAWSYNAANYILSYQDDGYVNGALSTRFSSTRNVDAQGQIIKITETDEVLSGVNAGTVNQVVDFSYNTYGEVEKILDSVTEAGVTTLNTTTISHDSSGNPTQVEVVESSATGATLATLRYGYTYDAMGNLTKRTYSKLNAMGGETESNTGEFRFNNEANAVLGGATRTYSINGSLVGSVQDILTYGSLDLSDITLATSNNLARLFRIYKRGTTKAQSEDFRYTWNTAGYLDAVKVDTTKLAADGATVTSRKSDSYSYAYDGNRLVSKTYDAATDGTFDENNTYTWVALSRLGEYTLEDMLFFLSEQQSYAAVNASDDTFDDTLPTLFAATRRLESSSSESSASSSLRSHPTLW